MRRICVCGLSLVFVLGCSSDGAKHVSAGKFERCYTKSQSVMLEQYFYAGETNGFIYISHRHLPLTYFSKMKYQLLYTETDGLPSDFLEVVRQSSPPHGGPATNWVGKPKAEPGGAANRSQPVGSEANSTSAAAGPGR